MTEDTHNGVCRDKACNETIDERFISIVYTVVIT